MNNRIVLLGDSIIDNTLYVEKYDVENHLKTLLEDDVIDNNSIDGVTTSEVLETVIKGGFSKDTTHFVISVGGNNLLNRKDLLLEEDTPDNLKTLFIKQDMYSVMTNDLLPIISGDHYSGYITEIEAIAVMLNYRYPKAEIVFLGLYEGNPSWNKDWETVEHLLPELIATHNENLQETIKRLNLRWSKAVASYIDITNTLKTEDYFNDIEPNDSGGLLIAEKIAAHINE
tara:strand:+ start:247 stop:933 length:687 start_codon:yes stop_codon:yes gene_type:complete